MDGEAYTSDAVPALGFLAAVTRQARDSRFVADEDVAQFRSRMPGLRAEVVPEAGHAVQSDQPLALARLIEEFVFG